MASKLPVIVIGGGVGGLATAIALAGKGYDVRVLEQAPVFQEVGAGIQLGPNVFRRFAALGVTDDIAPLAVYPDCLMLRDSITGEEVTSIPLGPRFEQRFQFPYAVIHRADLHDGLLRACRRCPRITLEPSRKVNLVENRGDHVRITTESDGAHDGAAVIGADGLWSTVRAQFVKDGKPRVSGHIAYRAVLPVAEFPEHLRHPSMVIWAGEKTHFVHYPLRGGELFNLVAVFHSSRYEEGWDSYGDPAELHERFAGTCLEVRTLLEKIESWRMWVLQDREPIKHWTFGLVTLLGDAAHPMLQYLAQGACMAIEDAVCLADQVEASGGDLAVAFQAYEQARYLRAARVQIYSRLYGEVYQAAGVAREVRNQLLSSRTTEEAYEGFAWLYDG